MRQSKRLLLKGLLWMRERGSSFIILNDEDMPQTGLKLGDSLNNHNQQIQSFYSKDNWGIYETN